METVSNLRQVLADNTEALMVIRGMERAERLWEKMKTLRSKISKDTVSTLLKPDKSNPTIETITIAAIALEVPVWVLISPWPVDEFGTEEDIKKFIQSVTIYCESPKATRGYVDSFLLDDAKQRGLIKGTSH